MKSTLNKLLPQHLYFSKETSDVDMQYVILYIIPLY